METKKALSRREVLRLAGVAAAGAVVAACGGTPVPTPTARVVEVTKVVEKPVTQVVEKQVTQVVEKVVQVTPTAKPAIKLKMWHHWGGTREPLMKKALEDFQARTPGVTVEPTIIPWDRKEESVTTAVAAGQAPDVLMVNASEMPPYALNKVLMPVDELVTQAGIKADAVYESEWKASFYEKRQYGLPQTVGGSAFMLFYNKKHFTDAGLDPAKPPATWTELLAAAKKLLLKEGNTIKRLGISLPAGMWSWLNYLAQNEASWLSDDGREVTMNNQGAVEALQFILDVVDAQGGQQAVAAFTTAGGDADAFISERASMILDGVWRYFYMRSSGPNVSYGSALAPNNKGKWHEANYGPHLYCLPVGGKNVADAWKLVLWMTRDDGQCNFLVAQLRPSPWKACNEGSVLSKTADYWPIVLSALGSARPDPLTPMFNKFGATWDEMIQRTTLKQNKPAEAIKWATDEMVKANNEYWAKRK